MKARPRALAGASLVDYLWEGILILSRQTGSEVAGQQGSQRPKGAFTAWSCCLTLSRRNYRKGFCICSLRKTVKCFKSWLHSGRCFICSDLFTSLIQRPGAHGPLPLSAGWESMAHWLVLFAGFICCSQSHTRHMLWSLSSKGPSKSS